MTAARTQFKLLLPGSCKAVSLALERVDKARDRQDDSERMGEIALDEVKAAREELASATLDLDGQFAIFINEARYK